MDPSSNGPTLPKVFLSWLRYVPLDDHLDDQWPPRENRSCSVMVRYLAPTKEWRACLSYLAGLGRGDRRGW